jgi:AcrR family transcriptional regulator
MAYHHGDLPRSVIKAARQLLAEAPEVPLSIRAAARRVGVSPNAPYRHFPDRDALLRAVAADGFRTVASRLARKSGAAAVARVWDELLRQEPALSGLMAGATTGSAEDADLQAAIAEWLGEVVRAIEGEVRGDDPARVVQGAVACWAAVHGMASLRRSGALRVIDDWLLPDPGVLARRVVAG